MFPQKIGYGVVVLLVFIFALGIFFVMELI